MRLVDCLVEQVCRPVRHQSVWDSASAAPVASYHGSVIGIPTFASGPSQKRETNFELTKALFSSWVTAELRLQSTAKTAVNPKIQKERGFWSGIATTYRTRRRKLDDVA